MSTARRFLSPEPTMLALLHIQHRPFTGVSAGSTPVLLQSFYHGRWGIPPVTRKSCLIYRLWKYLLVKEDVFAAPDINELFGARGQLVSRGRAEDLTDQSHSLYLQDMCLLSGWHSLDFWVFLNADVVKWSHIQTSGRFHPFFSATGLASWGGTSSLLTEGLLCSRCLGMLNRNKKMLHGFSRSISASQVNVALWESVTWVLHAPGGLISQVG